MLPLAIQMQIELSVAAHKREVTEGFARLRAKLLPEPKQEAGAAFRLAFLQAMMNAPPNYAQAQLAPSSGNPYSMSSLGNAALWGVGLWGSLAGNCFLTDLGQPTSGSCARN